MLNYGWLPAVLREQLRGRQALQSVLHNSVWLFGDQMFRMAAGLVTGVWTARYLGPDQFGWLSFALAAVGLVTSFTSLGVNAVVVRDLVRQPAEANALMGTALLLRGAGAALGLLVCVGVAVSGLVPVGAERVLIVIVAFGLLFQAFDVIDLLFQARSVARVSAWVRMGACAVMSVVKVALIVSNAPVSAFAVAAVLEFALCAAGWWWVAERRGWRIADWRVEQGRAVRLLRESWPIAASSFAVYAQAYADQLIVGSMLGSGELGQYAAAMRIVSAFAFVPMVVQVVAAPEVARAKAQDEALYRRRLHDLYRIMMILFLVVAIPLVLIGMPAAHLLYGSAYDAAAALLPLLALRLFFTNFGVARSIFLTNESLFRFALLTAIAGALTNVVLTLFLVPAFGTYGAILSSLVSFAVTTFALEIFEPRARANLLIMIRAMLAPWRRLAA